MNKPNPEKKTTLGLLIEINNTRTRHLNKMGAISATGAIVNYAKDVNDPTLLSCYEDLKEFTDYFGRSPENHFAGIILINLITEVELFFTDVVKQILYVYPKKLGGHTVKLKDILGKPEQEIIQLTVETHMNALMYKKPIEYIQSICEIMSIDVDSLMPRWIEFIEPKVRRDLGIHNDWKVNETYLRKLGEAGLKVDAKLGDDICPDEEYALNGFSICDQLVEGVYTLLNEKYSNKKNKVD